MSTQSKPQLKRRFAAAGIAGAAVIGALLIPTTAQAATVGPQTTEAAITTVTEAGAPVAATVRVDAVWQELMPGGSAYGQNAEGATFDTAKLRLDRAQADTNEFFASADRPAQRAYDAAYQAYLSGTGTVQQWLDKMPGQTSEMRALQARYDASPLAAEKLAASQAYSIEKTEMLAEAREVREIATDAEGKLAVAPAIGGGVAHPRVGLSSDSMVDLPYAPSSTTVLTVK